MFVDSAWLEKRLEDPNVAAVVDMSDETPYQRFPLPGAVHLAYGALVKERKADNIPDLCASGITSSPGSSRPARHRAREHHVVVYDDLGGLNAARLFWESSSVSATRPCPC